MAVPTAYLTSTKNTAGILDAMQRAAVPERFTFEFLKQLGFPSSSDRAIIPVFKSIGFLDQSGSPTVLYRRFKDKSLAPTALAEGLRLGYSDVFAVDTSAYAKNTTQLTGIFARLSDKGESVTAKMASTFKFFVGQANFAGESSSQESAELFAGAPSDSTPETVAEVAGSLGGSISLRHDIHLHLPISTDVSVYDAIFQSLKSHLL
jgi:hypothetical protein